MKYGMEMRSHYGHHGLNDENEKHTQAHNCQNKLTGDRVFTNPPIQYTNPTLLLGLNLSFI